MKNLSTKLFSVILLFLSIPTLAQDILDNKGIVNLLGSKMSQDIVITKISSSKCKFDFVGKWIIGTEKWTSSRQNREGNVYGIATD